ncbi:MAG: type II secretion system protein N [Pseudomonadota bacterium]
MRRYIIIGALLFLSFAVAFAPSGLVDRLVDRVDGVELLGTSGTLWQGRGDLYVTQHNAGQLSWDFNPSALLQMQAGYNWELRSLNGTLNGYGGASPTHFDVDLQGAVGLAFFEPWLERYNLTIEGDLTAHPSSITIDHGAGLIVALEGQLDWSGGEISYGLAGVTRYAGLPPLTAFLQKNGAGQPEAVVYARGSDTPLLIATPGMPGFIKIGMTKKFSSLLGRPWPGRAADHEVVLEVEEQIF